MLLGSRDDVAELMQAMDIFVFPSKWEGLPVTVVEAQVAGLPCFISSEITKDVNTSSLVKYLPIDEGPDVWINELLNADLTRKNVIDEIKKAGFDVKETAQQLTTFYQEQHSSHL
jgi:glycosyltransferase involved in cell wall biosynthesis